MACGQENIKGIAGKIKKILSLDDPNLSARAARFLVWVKDRWEGGGPPIDGYTWEDFTAALTCVIAERAISYPEDALQEGQRLVDFPSTGGIGNKTPLLASFLALARIGNVVIPKISSRGESGGTIDLLEAVGLQANPDPEAFQRLLREVGIGVMAQTEKVAWLDHTLMSLRRQTGTMRCTPLVVSSVLGKKLAVGCKYLVVDIKAGPDSKFRDLGDMQRAIGLFHEVWHRVCPDGKIQCVVTNNYVPQGTCFGRLLSLWEVAYVLSLASGSSSRLSGSALRRLSAIGDSLVEAMRGLIDGPPGSGPSAFERFLTLLERQGVSKPYIDALRGVSSEGVPQTLLRQKEAEGGCKIRRAQALAQSKGKILVIDMDVLDRVLSWLTKEGDPSVGGIRLLKDIGEEVNKGDPLAEVYTTSYTLAEKAALALQRYAFCIGDDGNKQEKRREYIKKSLKGEALERWVNTLLDQFDRPTMNIEEPA